MQRKWTASFGTVATRDSCIDRPRTTYRKPSGCGNLITPGSPRIFQRDRTVCSLPRVSSIECITANTGARRRVPYMIIFSASNPWLDIEEKMTPRTSGRYCSTLWQSTHSAARRVGNRLVFGERTRSSSQRMSATRVSSNNELTHLIWSGSAMKTTLLFRQASDAACRSAALKEECSKPMHCGSTTTSNLLCALSPYQSVQKYLYSSQPSAASLLSGIELA